MPLYHWIFRLITWVFLDAFAHCPSVSVSSSSSIAETISAQHSPELTDPHHCGCSQYFSPVFWDPAAWQVSTIPLDLPHLPPISGFPWFFSALPFFALFLLFSSFTLFLFLLFGQYLCKMPFLLYLTPQNIKCSVFFVLSISQLLLWQFSVKLVCVCLLCFLTTAFQQLNFHSFWRYNSGLYLHHYTRWNQELFLLWP